MQKQFKNPFYVILLVAGLLFLLTVCSYSVVAVQGIDPSHASNSVEEAGFGKLVDRHGSTVLLVELAVLALATVAAIATDQYWMNREAETPTQESDSIGGESR